MVKLSIIIPYYETFDYAERILKELILQKTDNVEIIVVDDGCNETRLDKYKEVNIIHLKQNGGVSKARNTGIENAKGQYIAFIDSDDMITMDYVSQLLNIIDEHNEDVIVFNWVDTTTNDIVRLPHNPAVWKAIYKKDIIPMFDETLRVREDYYFQQDLDKLMPTKYYYDRILYMYNSNREGSLWWNERHKQD